VEKVALFVVIVKGVVEPCRVGVTMNRFGLPAFLRGRGMVT
jgi:hypothetical protein